MLQLPLVEAEHHLVVEGESGSWDFKSQSAKSHRQSSLCSTFCTSHFSCISELQTSVSPLSLRTILIKSTFVHIAPLPGIGWQHGRGHCVLIPVALGPARAFVPVWKTLACGGCPASCSGRGWKGLLVTRLQFCFFPPIHNPFHAQPITDSANLLGEPAWLGTKGKERN